MNKEATKSLSGSTIFQKALKYGLMGNFLLIVGMGIFYFFLDNLITGVRNSSLFIALIFMFFAVREYRAENSNQLMFWQGTFVGLFTFFVFAVVSTLIIYVFTGYVHPESLTSYVNFKLNSLEQYREMLGEDEYRIYREKTVSLGPSGVAMDHLFTQFYVGLFGSAIVAALLRKTPTSA
jgi:hypothetical protein